MRLCLVLVLQLGCVTPLAIPQGAGTMGMQDGSDAVTRSLDAVLNLRDLPRAPAVPPHKKAPQFMLDLFNAVTVTKGTPKSQKEILEGNIVRSFEDKGEQKLVRFNYTLKSGGFVRNHVIS